MKMKHIAKFDNSPGCKMILKDSYKNDVYYGLDDFDCKYLKIIQAKFGCLNSFHTIPNRVKMEMAPFEWDDKIQKFVLNDKKSLPVQLNQLESMVVNYSKAIHV